MFQLGIARTVTDLVGQEAVNRIKHMQLNRNNCILKIYTERLPKDNLTPTPNEEIYQDRYT